MHMRDADCDEGDLSHQLGRDVRHDGREGERRRDTAQDDGARTDDHAAELREGKDVARAVARLAADDAGDEIAQMMIGHQREPATAHHRDDGESVQTDENKTADADGSDGAEDSPDADMQQQPDRDGQSDQRGDEDTDFHRRIRPSRRLVSAQRTAGRRGS